MTRPCRKQENCRISMQSSWPISLQVFLLLLLRGEGANADATTSPEVINRPVITPQRSIVSKGQNLGIVEEVEILKSTIELLCNLTDIPNKPPNITGYWKKDGKEMNNSQHTVFREHEQYFLNRTFNIQADNPGNYSCIFSYAGKEEAATFVLKVPVMKVKSDKPIVSYIGDTVKLQCEIFHAPNTWKWYRANGTIQKELINATAEPLRYEIWIEKNETKLTVINLTEEDSGTYLCSAVYDIKPVELRMGLKVLSFWEPLKPFLAIVVEVVILVALILLYERRNQSRQKSLATENGLHSDQTHKLTQEENNAVEDGTTTRQRKV